MDLTDLNYLIAAAECGTFAGAARILNVRTSTISRSVSHLEDELGTSLFERTAAGTRLTASGADVLVHARKVQGDIQALRSEIQLRATASTGEVRLGITVPGLGNPIRDLLSQWRTDQPGVSINAIDLKEGDAAGAIIGRRVDAVLVPDFGLWPHADAVPVYTERFVAAIFKDDPLASHETLTWSSFTDTTLLIRTSDDNPNKRQVFSPLLESGVRFQPHAASMQTILGLVGCGFGSAIVQSGMATSTFANVVFKPIDEAAAAFQVHLAWNAEVKDPAIGKFVAFMRDQSRLNRAL